MVVRCVVLRRDACDSGVLLRSCHRLRIYQQSAIPLGVVSRIALGQAICHLSYSTLRLVQIFTEIYIVTNAVPALEPLLLVSRCSEMEASLTVSVNERV